MGGGNGQGWGTGVSVKTRGWLFAGECVSVNLRNGVRCPTLRIELAGTGGGVIPSSSPLESVLRKPVPSIIRK